MTFKAPDSLAEQIAHHLAERIIRGEMKPGSASRNKRSRWRSMSAAVQSVRLC